MTLIWDNQSSHRSPPTPVLAHGREQRWMLWAFLKLSSQPLEALKSTIPRSLANCRAFSRMMRPESATSLLRIESSHSHTALLSWSLVVLRGRLMRSPLTLFCRALSSSSLRLMICTI
ncbi:hypothetical protein FKM82_024489 [Ascaphus truei]